MGASGSDQAVAAILKWSGREGWRERFDAVIAAHLAPACEAAGVAPDELPELVNVLVEPARHHGVRRAVLLVYTAEPGSTSAERLRLLASWAATEQTPTSTT